MRERWLWAVVDRTEHCVFGARLMDASDNIGFVVGHGPGTDGLYRPGRRAGNHRKGSLMQSPPSLPSFLLEIGKGAAFCTIPMILHCPGCGMRHIDEGAFAKVAHHTHACQGCGMVWRPAKVNTHGVQFLPGYKNEGDE